MRMRRFVPHLGIVAAFIFYLFIVAVADEISSRSPTVPENISGLSTLSIEFPSPAQILDANPDEQDARLEPSPQKEARAAAPVSAPIPAPAKPEAAPLIVDEEGLNAAARALRSALVNIICYAPAGSRIRSISGSGVLIDSEGIILTNAHIAQYLLLKDQHVSCTIRTGGPATDQYHAELIYIPAPWLTANPTVLTADAPIGTGEYDFAFLAVSKSATAAPLPSSYPSVPLAVSPPLAKTPVVIATYGAQFIDSGQIQSSLFPTIVFGSVKDVFTFKSNTIDVLALGGSAAAQEGSSGGGVADSAGRLVGTITTSTTKGTTDTRSLDAITASYIRAAYASDTGRPLDLLLSEPTSASIGAFAEKIPELAAIITAHL